MENGNSLISCQRGHWRPAEDEKLRGLVEQYGPQNWNSIADHFQGRSGKSCRLKWYSQLDPNINRRSFTEEEEERLLKAHAIQGNKWASIATLFPGRTDNAVKNHYHVLMARLKKRQRFSSSSTNIDSTSSNYFQSALGFKGKLSNLNTANSASSSTVITDYSLSLDHDQIFDRRSYNKDQHIDHMFNSSNNNQISALSATYGNCEGEEEEEMKKKGTSSSVSFIDFLGVGYS